MTASVCLRRVTTTDDQDGRKEADMPSAKSIAVARGFMYKKNACSQPAAPTGWPRRSLGPGGRLLQGSAKPDVEAVGADPSVSFQFVAKRNGRLAEARRAGQ